ncbi:MAG: DUF2500 family protein [Clostridia bacterium]|nr:DUF2500 family protein [Clostridia bacterium]
MYNLYTVVLKDTESSVHIETDDLISIVVIGVIMLVLAIGIINAFIREMKKRKQLLKDFEKPIELSPITEVDAVVVKKKCFVKSCGTKMPESVREFYLTFSTFSGEYKRYSVSEELYLSVDEGVSGTIALVDDEFFDFYFEG